MGYGEFIKQARKNKGYTLFALSQKVGVSAVAISDWENEKYPPTNANNISALETALGLPSGEIYQMLYGNPTKSPLCRERAEAKKAV